MKIRWIAALSIVAAACAFAVGPSLFARGGSGSSGAKSSGGSGSGMDSGTDDGSEPPPDENPDSDKGKGITKKKYAQTIDGKDVPRDGLEQVAIAREAFDGLARGEFTRLRDELNRRSVDPRPVETARK